MTYPFPPCPVCGYAIDADHDLDPTEQQKYELHMGAELLTQLKRIADSLESLDENGISAWTKEG